MAEPVETLKKRIERAYRKEKKRLMTEVGLLRTSYAVLQRQHRHLDLKDFDDLPAAERQTVLHDASYDQQLIARYYLDDALAQSAQHERGFMEPELEAEIRAIYGLFDK